MFRVIAVFSLSGLLLSCQPEIPVAAAAEANEQYAAPEYMNPNPRAPYSEGVRYGGLIFLAGKTGGPGESGVQPETRRTLESIEDALERFGSSMEKVVKCTVFLVDMDEWGAMNEVYSEFFPENKPARTTVGISLGGDTRVEIECIAAA
ncbi:MAG: RidA family protein [Gammaproteobacteria bacterium]|nr:RidA family protein [Gammaproteobacteria bacterium]MDD9894714.1 RidA family protein [Gammaproteobacteria bacterium]MDD9957388.1 RidA family protein [Gammaproteobacteria bacterium]